ncbi:hypothetical protein NPIL_96191 [Nephila pilipes]|uniref:Uncharacterized protein n=1 Tax=Nephila pilipes TaxID=299642 RepID=A0A8X6QGJ0_NEPPI|nr:hypothetical protein NPIL_96191 [Nephila pilipes]
MTEANYSSQALFWPAQNQMSNIEMISHFVHVSGWYECCSFVRSLMRAESGKDTLVAWTRVPVTLLIFGYQVPVFCVVVLSENSTKMSRYTIPVLIFFVKAFYESNKSPVTISHKQAVVSISTLSIFCGLSRTSALTSALPLHELDGKPAASQLLKRLILQ